MPRSGCSTLHGVNPFNSTFTDRMKSPWEKMHNDNLGLLIKQNHF